MVAGCYDGVDRVSIKSHIFRPESEGLMRNQQPEGGDHARNGRETDLCHHQCVREVCHTLRFPEGFHV